MRGEGGRRRVLLPRRRSDLVQFLVAGAVLALCALPIDPDRVGAAEIALFHAVNRLPDAAYWPVWAVMQCGQLLAVPAAAVVAVLARRVRLALDLVLAGGLAYFLAKVVKELVFRGRPGQLLDDVVLRHAPASGHGFVAGHAATAFALAAAALPYLGRRGRGAVVGAAVIVAVARVYVGAHLPLDVVGGAALGWMSGSLVHVLLGSPDPGATLHGGRASVPARPRDRPLGGDRRVMNATTVLQRVWRREPLAARTPIWGSSAMASFASPRTAESASINGDGARAAL